VSIDISSNDFSGEMSQLLLDSIGASSTITCAIIGSAESLNKNKIGKTGLENLY